MIRQVTTTFFKIIKTPALVATNKALFSQSPFQNNGTDINQSWKQNKTAQQIKTSQIVAKNTGLRSFITRTYNTTALSAIGALSGAYIGSSIPLLAMNPMGTAIIGAIATIGSFWAVQSMKPNNIVERINGIPVYRTENSIARLLTYSLGVLSLGLSASPMFLYTQMLNPSIIPSAIGITCGIFGGASAMAYMMPKDKMLGYGKILMGSLLGLIGMNLIGIGSALFMGPNALSSLLFSIDNYVGILLFCGLIGYDTHVAIKQYQNGLADHLAMSIQLLLNFWNILIRVMSILGQRD